MFKKLCRVVAFSTIKPVIVSKRSCCPNDRDCVNVVIRTPFTSSNIT